MSSHIVFYLILNQLKERVKTLGLEDKVAFSGYVADEDLPDIYRAADLFVHAGRWETFGIVSLEAQACGTPVLAVRGGGLEESLSCEKAPLLAAAGTPEALAAALDGALARPFVSPSERVARHHALADRFSIDRTFEKIFALYQRLIDRGRLGAVALAPTQVVDPARAQ